MPEKGEKLGIAQVPIRATLDELDKDLAAVQGKIAGPLQKAVDGAQGQIDQAISKIAKGMVIGGIGALVGGIAAAGKLAVDALPLQALSDAFAGVSGDAEEMLAKLHEGSLGMVRDADLMRTYNTAAQLVSKTFADQLPQAMGYLSKVSAATGQDMGFMLDSLVKGVGRLSPMILDNLGIQVALSDATARAAQMFGVQEDSLTKTQTQAGMMAVVMEKLQANTATMPEVAESAQQQWASLGVTLANIKDKIGVALLPALSKVMSILSNFVIEVTGGPEFAETIGRIADGLAWLVEKGGQALDWLHNISPQAIAVAGAFSGLAIILPTLISTIGGVATAITAAGGAFTAFSALLAANPVGLAAIAIAAAGLGIAAIVNQIQKSNQDLATSAQATANSIAASATSYEEYVSAMGAGTSDLDYAARASEALDGTLNEQQAALVMTKQEWLDYKASLEAGTAAISGSADALRALREADAATAQGYGLTGKAAADMAAQMSQSQVLMQQYAEQAKAASANISQAWADAFKADEVQKALMAIQTVVIDHQQEMASLVSDFQAQQIEAQFQFDVQRLQAEQQYQREHAALLDAGRVEDAIKLEQKFTEQDGIARANFSVQQQLQQRALIVQQIQRQQAYIEELKEQSDQVRRTLALAITKSEAFLKLTAEEQKGILDTVYAGGSEKLLMEREFANKSVEITTLMAQGNINAAKEQVQAFLALQQGNLDAADSALADLQAKLSSFHIELPELPALNVEPLTANIPSATREAAERATEPATRTLEQVAEDIQKAIASAKEAIKSLVDVEIPTGVEAGLEKISGFLTMAVTRFYEMLSPLKEQVAGVKDLVSPVNELMQLITGSTQAMTGFQEPPELPDTRNWADRLLDLTQLVVATLNSVEKEIGSDAIAEVKELSGDVRTLLGLVGVALKFEPAEAAEFEKDAELYVNQLRFLVGRLFEWMRQIVRLDLAQAIEEASALPGKVKEFFSLIGPDLSKIVPVADFEPKAVEYVNQLRFLIGRLFEWMRRIIRLDLAKAIEEAATLPASVKEFFTLIGPDLSKLVPDPSPRFYQRAEDYIGQLQKVGQIIYRWMQGILASGLDEAYGLAGEVSTKVKDLFAVLDISINVPTLGASFGPRLLLFINDLKQAAPLLRDGLAAVAREWENLEALDTSVAISKKLKELFDILSLDKAFEELRVIQPLQQGQRRTALSNIVNRFLIDLKTVAPPLATGLAEVEALFNGALDSSLDIAEKIKGVFEAISGAVSAGIEITNAEDWDFARLLDMIHQLEQAMTEIGQIRMPSIAVAMPQPAMMPASETLSPAFAGLDISESLKEGIVEGLQNSELVVTLEVKGDVEERRQFSMKLGRLERLMETLVTQLEAAGG